MKIQGYASRFDRIDSNDDIILEGAFLDSIREWEKGRRPIPMLFNHDAARIIGVWTHLQERPGGLYVEGTLLPHGEGASLIPLIEAGALKGISIGYRATCFHVTQKRDHDSITAKSHREIQDLDLIEISLVACPSCPGAVITRTMETTRCPSSHPSCPT